MTEWDVYQVVQNKKHEIAMGRKFGSSTEMIILMANL
jgi:hypothetical protein